MALYQVTLQVLEEDVDGHPPTGPEVSGLMMVAPSALDDRKAWVQEFGWLGHDMLEELKRQWQITCTVSEASAS